MTEQNQTPEMTDDTEGHRRYSSADGLGDVEDLDSMEDDTEGHHRKTPGADDILDDDDDADGHSWRAG